MSISHLLLAMSIVSSAFFIYMSAKQFVTPNRVLHINHIIVPVWIWVFGIFISSLLTTIEILRYVGLLFFFPTSLITVDYILVLSILVIFSFVVILIQFSSSFGDLNGLQTFFHSILAGFAACFGLSSLMSLLWIASDSEAAGNINGLICVLIPVQIIASAGVYSKLRWQKGFEKNAKSFYEDQVTKSKK